MQDNPRRVVSAKVVTSVVLLIIVAVAAGIWLSSEASPKDRYEGCLQNFAHTNPEDPSYVDPNGAVLCQRQTGYTP